VGKDGACLEENKKQFEKMNFFLAIALFHIVDPVYNQVMISYYLFFKSGICCIFFYFRLSSIYTRAPDKQGNVLQFFSLLTLLGS
jgi:hypothetical protein